MSNTSIFSLSYSFFCKRAQNILSDFKFGFLFHSPWSFPELLNSDIVVSKQMHDTPSSVPKFGFWERDPKSGDGFTVIFNKVKQEKQVAATKLPKVPTDPIIYPNNHKNHAKSSSRPKVLFPDSIIHKKNHTTFIWKLLPFVLIRITCLLQMMCCFSPAAKDWQSWMRTSGINGRYIQVSYMIWSS